MLVAFPGGSPLVQDYLAGEAGALARLGWDFRDPESYRRRAAQLSQRFSRHHREVAAAAIRSPSERAAEAVRRVVEEDGFFVTTGQQPGLFTGPLYSLYKALTAVRLANTLEEVIGRPVAPLFWVASEDHDWAEVDNTFLLDPTNALHRVRYPVPPECAGRPLLRCRLGEGIGPTLDHFLDLLPRSDFFPEDRELLQRSYPPHATLPSGFTAILEALVGPLGLSFVDAGDPVVKELSRPILEEEALGSESREALLAGVAGELETAGYPVQVPILPGGVNLFLEGPAGRERVYREDGGFRLRHSGERLGAAELRARLAGDPSVASPNVLLRPAVEGSIFPVLSYVAGPGEVAYYGQLREYLDVVGPGIPVIHPRFGATLVEGKIRKVLDRFALAPEALARPHHELAGELVREEMPEAVRRALGEFRGAVGRGTASLVSAVREIDPTLKGPVESVRNQALVALQETERRIVQSLKRENEVALGQLERASLHLYPGGKPQERVLNLFYYTSRFGRGWIGDLLERFTPPVAGTEFRSPLPAPVANR